MAETRTITLKLFYANICLYPIDFEVFETCCGFARTQRRRCCDRVAKKVRFGSQAIIRNLVNGADLSSSLLEDLATRLLCSRNHRDQAPDIKAALIKAFKTFFRNSTPVIASPIARYIPVPTPMRVSPPVVPRVDHPAQARASRPVAHPATPTVENYFERYHDSIVSAERIATQLEDLANGGVSVGRPKPGFIYMFKYSDSSTKGHFKIGRSENIRQRMEAIRRSCKTTPIVIDDPQQRLIQHVYLAEKLVFALLRNHRRRIRTCAGCQTGHIEWFEIDEASALRVIEKVRQFMEDRYGRISPDYVVTPSNRSGQTRFFQLVEMARELERRGKLTPSAVRSSAQDVQRVGPAHVRRIPTLDDFLQELGRSYRLEIPH